MANLAYDEQIGIEREWQALDGPITKAPLGRKRNRSQSCRPQKEEHQKKLVD